jgi:hypothetical protein
VARPEFVTVPYRGSFLLYYSRTTVATIFLAATISLQVFAIPNWRLVQNNRVFTHDASAIDKKAVSNQRSAVSLKKLSAISDQQSD